jgi:tetratricopeptide (TPR) repeat protein
VQTYLGAVSASLLRAPGVPTAVAVEEWLSRLDALLKQNRQSEIGTLQDWMEIAFGRDSAEQPRPLDLRVHTRLGDVYLTTRSYPRAVRQFELAREIAPRDIYVLRSLGRAYLETKDRDSAEAIIERIVELDAQALERNAECAALAARFQREGLRLKDAIAILGRALTHNPDSYYLANLQGEISLEAGDLEQATAAFHTALDILARLRETNIWTHATAANAAFVVGDDRRAIEQLKAVVATKPDADELAIVERGLRRLAAFLARGDERMASLAAVLHPQVTDVAAVAVSGIGSRLGAASS